jgi:hypothetical protein
VNAGDTMTPNHVHNAAAEAAIAQVLRAEREARGAIVAARLEVEHIAESARAAARATAERAERRIRRVTAAFEADLAARLAEIHAQAAGLGQVPPLSEAEATALRRAVQDVAVGMVGVGP